MRNGRGKLNVAHAFAAHLGFCDFNPAAVADNALVADTLIFSAVAFPVLCRPEYPFAVKPVFLRLQCPVIDGFGLLDLAP